MCILPASATGERFRTRSGGLSLFPASLGKRGPTWTSPDFRVMPVSAMWSRCTCLSSVSLLTWAGGEKMFACRISAMPVEVRDACLVRGFRCRHDGCLVCLDAMSRETSSR